MLSVRQFIIAFEISLYEYTWSAFSSLVFILNEITRQRYREGKTLAPSFDWWLLLPDSSPNSSLLVSSHLDFQTHLRLIFDSFVTHLWLIPYRLQIFSACHSHFLSYPLWLPFLSHRCSSLRSLVSASVHQSPFRTELILSPGNDFLMKVGSVYAYFKNYVFSLFLLFITSLFYNESGVFRVVFG